MLHRILLIALLCGTLPLLSWSNSEIIKEQAIEIAKNVLIKTAKQDRKNFDINQYECNASLNNGQWDVFFYFKGRKITGSVQDSWMVPRVWVDAKTGEAKMESRPEGWSRPKGWGVRYTDPKTGASFMIE
jgi:hypothetical protein